MGTIWTADGALVQAYGDLAIRFNNLRDLYRCVVARVNTGASPADCVKS